MKKMKKETAINDMINDLSKYTWKGNYKKAYTTHGLLLSDKDLAIVVGNNPNPIKVELPESVTVSCDTIYVEGDFNRHDLITVQLGSLSNGLEPEDINCFSHFEIDVQIFENDETDLQIKDRNFKLEDLSMDLQKRIYDVAEKMRADKMKFIHY